MKTLEEEIAVVEWRFATLTRSGYDVDGAAAIAARFEIDLHCAADLVTRGCPPDLALRILL
jgi:hypothetical protein